MSGSNTWVHEDGAWLKDGVILLPTLFTGIKQILLKTLPEVQIFFEGADIYTDCNAGLKVLVKASSVNATKKESCWSCFYRLPQ